MQEPHSLPSGAWLTIRTIPIEPPDVFQDQVDLVKSSGAEYDGATRTWSHHLTAAHLTAAVLDPLFRAAREYGTHIEVGTAV